MGVWNDYANKVKMESYLYADSKLRGTLDTKTGKISWETSKQEDVISDDIKEICLRELKAELETQGFEVKIVINHTIHIIKHRWEITLDLEGNLPYSDALVKAIKDNYKQTER